MSIQAAAAQILALIAKAPARALVAIDGHSAAGKSSLARAVQAGCRQATIVQADDFYRPLDPFYRDALDAAAGYAEYYDWQRLEDQVLRPLRAGRPARYQRYDWARNQLADWAEVGGDGPVIVEGCYSARPELRGHYDAIALVVSSPAERAHRQRLRADASPAWLERWDAAERHYMERFRPDTYADVVLSGQ